MRCSYIVTSCWYLVLAHFSIVWIKNIIHLYVIALFFFNRKQKLFSTRSYNRFAVLETSTFSMSVNVHAHKCAICLLYNQFQFFFYFTPSNNSVCVYSVVFSSSVFFSTSSLRIFPKQTYTIYFFFFFFSWIWFVNVWVTTVQCSVQEGERTFVIGVWVSFYFIQSFVVAVCCVIFFFFLLRRKFSNSFSVLVSAHTTNRL